MFLAKVESGFLREVVIVVTIFFTYILVAIGRSYPAFLLPQLNSPQSSVIITSNDASWIASLNLLFCPVGCFIGGLIVDKCGRKFTLRCAVIPFIAFWLINIYTDSVLLLYVGQSLQGVAGGLSFCSSLLVAEIATVEHRGPLLSIIDINYGLGIILCNLTMFYLHWKVASIFFCMLSVVCFVLLSFVPESPLWLLLNGKSQKSIEILTTMRCKDLNSLENEIKDMEKSCELLCNKMKTSESLKRVIHSWKPFAMLTGLFIISQFSGYNILTVFLVIFIEQLHLPYDSSVLALSYSTTALLGSIMTPFVMTKYGRRTVLMISGGGMAISIFITAVYQELYFASNNPNISWIVPAALYFYGVMCAMGVIPLTFVLGGELFPLEVRGVMNGLYGSFSFICAAATLKLFPTMLEAIGIRNVLWIFMIFSINIFLYGKYILPETKGKTLNQVQEEYFQKKK